MTNGSKTTGFGVASLILSIIAIPSLFIPFAGSFVGLALSIIAIIFGVKAFWKDPHKDPLGLAGFIIGLIALILSIIVLISFIFYIFISSTIFDPPSMETPEMSSNLSYTYHSNNNELVITSVSPSYLTYADSSYSPNLIFKRSGYTTEYYVDNYNTLTSYSSACTDYINAGDTISSFLGGYTYNIILNPTNEIIGSFYAT